MSKRIIYADHAATTPLMPEAFEAMLPFLREEFGNPSSLHSWARGPRNAVVDARIAIADYINAKPEQIYFTSGGTESDNWAIKKFGVNGIVTTAIEHHAVLNACENIGKEVPVGYAYPDEKGRVPVDRLFMHVDADPKHRKRYGLMSVMMANNEVGTIQSIKEIAEKVKASRRSRLVRVDLLHTDAVQAVGNIPVDVVDLGVDFLSASAHKFNGPKGIGFLYVKNPLKLVPYIDGGMQESGMRAGTENVAAIVGMAVALQKNVRCLEKNMRHKRHLAEMFRELLAHEFPEAVFNGDGSRSLPGFVSVGFPGRNAESIMHVLDLKGIAVSTGAACDSKNTQISHVLRAMGLSEELAKGTLRITFGKDNTEENVRQIIAGLRTIIR